MVRERQVVGRDGEEAVAVTEGMAERTLVPVPVIRQVVGRRSWRRLGAASGQR